MLNSWKQKIKDAASIFLDKKNTEAVNRKPILEESRIDNLPPFSIDNQELKDLIASIKIEFFFSEFGENRVNAGDGQLSSENRLNPSLATIRHYFPNAKFTVFSDFDLEIPGVVLNKIVASPIPDKDHPRYLYRTADYFKFKSLLESDADFRCVMDSDMFVYSPKIFALVYLTKIFGFCAPYNARNLLKKDMEISLDTKKVEDASLGFGHSYNQSPMTLWKGCDAGIKFYETCCEIMIKEPSRASIVMWKAARKTGYSPYLLPQQWCVCGEDVGIGNETILHVGHQKVADYYNIKM